MICPKCHNENNFDAITCDFCMATLPMSSKRKEEILKKQKIAKKNKMKKSVTKLIGLVAGVLALALVVVIAYIIRKH